jgi:hypothetical protein
LPNPSTKELKSKFYTQRAAEKQYKGICKNNGQWPRLAPILFLHAIDIRAIMKLVKLVWPFFFLLNQFMVFRLLCIIFFVFPHAYTNGPPPVPATSGNWHHFAGTNA